MTNSELKKSDSTINKFIWVVDLSQTVEIQGKKFNFFKGCVQPIEDDYLDNEWFQSAIQKGYLKAVS